MNKAAIKKHEIYGKLRRLTGSELSTVADFIDFMRYKRHPPQERKIIKLQGILSEYDIDLSAIKEFKKNSWKHLEEEFDSE